MKPTMKCTNCGEIVPLPNPHVVVAAGLPARWTCGTKEPISSTAPIKEPVVLYDAGAFLFYEAFEGTFRRVRLSTHDSKRRVLFSASEIQELIGVLSKWLKGGSDA